MGLKRQGGVHLVAAVEQVVHLPDHERIHRHCPGEIVGHVLRLHPEERPQGESQEGQAHEDDTPQPKPSRIGRPTARGGRRITSSSCGSKEMTSPSATDVTMFTHRIWGAVMGAVKPTKIAATMTSASATFVGSMKRIAFSMLL